MSILLKKTNKNYKTNMWKDTESQNLFSLSKCINSYLREHEQNTQ